MRDDRALTAARERLRDWRGWMAQHGATREGYIARYGSADDVEHFGAGGEAIWAADGEKLRERERDVCALEALAGGEYPYLTVTSTVGTTRQRPWSVARRERPCHVGEAVSLHRTNIEARDELRAWAARGYRVHSDVKAERIFARVAREASRQCASTSTGIVVMDLQRSALRLVDRMIEC